MTETICLINGELYLVRPIYATEEKEPVLAQYLCLDSGSEWEFAYFVYFGTDLFDGPGDVEVIQHVKVVPA